MAKYFKVKYGTPQEEKFKRYWSQQDNYDKNKAEINELLGGEHFQDLALDNETLTMQNIPTHLADQFKKKRNDGWFEAKRNSSINKKWIKFAKEKELDSYSTVELIVVDLGLWKGEIRTIYAPIDGGYYFVSEKDDYDWSRHDWCEEIDEIEFLRLRADYLEKNKK